MCVQDDMSAATVKQRNRSLGWQTAMHQSLGQTRSLSESVALLFAASKVVVVCSLMCSAASKDEIEIEMARFRGASW